MNIFHDPNPQWPLDKPRQEPESIVRYPKATWSEAIQRIESEVSAFTPNRATWRTTSLTIAAAGKLGARGKFIAGIPTSNEVIVAFDLDGEEYVIACDTYACAIQNACAIAAHIEGLRRQERNGLQTLKEMLSGFAALPTRSKWFEGCRTVTDIDARYKALAREHHPDKGGDSHTMAEINDAKTQAMKQVQS